MSTTQMRERCPSASIVGIGFVPGFRLAFNRKGSYRDGGVASIVRTGNEDDRAYGVIWELKPEELRRLDEIEDPNAYVPQTVHVIDESGASRACRTYIAIPQSEYISPDPEYFDKVLSAANEIGLPREYVRQIESFDPELGRSNMNDDATQQRRK